MLSYCGAQIFEIYGLGNEVVDFAFRGSISKIGGLTFDEVRSVALSLSENDVFLCIRKDFIRVK